MCLCKTSVLCANSLMDFQKGERYVKIKGATDPLPIFHKADQYGLFHLQCFAYHTEPMDSTLILYDVACQWSINFHQCVQDSDILSLPAMTDLIAAVGKCHLEAHMSSCLQCVKNGVSD